MTNTPHTPADWTLHELEPQANGERQWSVGVNGPRAYLTCDEWTALLIVQAPTLLAQRNELREALQDMVAMMDNGDEHGKGSPWYIKAKAALAKANP